MPARRQQPFATLGSVGYAFRFIKQNASSFAQRSLGVRRRLLIGSAPPCLHRVKFMMGNVPLPAMHMKSLAQFIHMELSQPYTTERRRRWILE